MSLLDHAALAAAGSLGKVTHGRRERGINGPVGHDAKAKLPIRCLISEPLPMVQLGGDELAQSLARVGGDEAFVRLCDRVLELRNLHTLCFAEGGVLAVVQD
ncbi:hypothetical protein D9M68_899700 [compost metagenome]